MTASWSRILAGWLALQGCQGTERSLEKRPAPIEVPSPPRAEQSPHDTFHALLTEPDTNEVVDEVSAQQLKAAVERNNAAAIELWSALKPKENFVVSPYSIRSALGLVYLGSTHGLARSRLQSRLHYPARNEELDVRLLRDCVKAADQTSFGFASGLWVDRKHTLAPAYLAAVSRNLPAEVHAIDFAADPGRAARTIDAWASERTRGQIPNIMARQAIPDDQAILADVAYLLWRVTSPSGNSEVSFSRSFSTSHGTTVKADMMLCAPCVAVVRNDYQLAGANYRGTSLVFVVVMPKSWRDFHWNAATFRRVQASLKEARIAELELPKLRLRSRTDLAATMSTLDVQLGDPQLLQGQRSSFDSLSVGAFIHEASLQIDETTLANEPSLHLSKELLGKRSSVRVDRPFYFMLIEPKTGVVLLMGQVTDPTA